MRVKVLYVISEFERKKKRLTSCVLLHFSNIESFDEAKNITACVFFMRGCWILHLRNMPFHNQ